MNGLMSNIVFGIGKARYIDTEERVREVMNSFPRGSFDEKLVV